tara:strand:- start:2811 stop:3209 length:399 start_codon:yes stop_codon:yes gene_type:complete
MAGPNQIIIDSNVNDISLDVTNNIIEVVDNNCPSEIQITQPVTRIVEVTTTGPQGPIGPAGIEGGARNFIATGSVSASVELTGDIFTVTSASADIFSINYQGVIILQEQDITPNPTRGGLFFSGSGDFYLGS